MKKLRGPTVKTLRALSTVLQDFGCFYSVFTVAGQPGNCCNVQLTKNGISCDETHEKDATLPAGSGWLQRGLAKFIYSNRQSRNRSGSRFLFHYVFRNGTVQVCHCNFQQFLRLAQFTGFDCGTQLNDRFARPGFECAITRLFFLGLTNSFFCLKMISQFVLRFKQRGRLRIPRWYVKELWRKKGISAAFSPAGTTIQGDHQVVSSPGLNGCSVFFTVSSNCYWAIIVYSLVIVSVIEALHLNVAIRELIFTTFPCSFPAPISRDTSSFLDVDTRPSGPGFFFAVT